MALAVARSTLLSHTSGADTLATSFASLPSAGSLIVVPIWYFTANVAAGQVTDNQGNTYNLAVGLGTQSGIFFAFNIGAPSGTFTVTLNGPNASDTEVFNAIEVTGALTTNPVDRTANGNGTTTGNTPLTTQADEIIIAVGERGADGSPGVPASYTLIVEEIDDATYRGGESVYKIVSTRGGQFATWPVAMNSSCIATFKGIPVPVGVQAGTPTWQFPHPPMRVN